MRRLDKMVSEFEDSIEATTEVLEKEGILYAHEIKNNILMRGGKL